MTTKTCTKCDTPKELDKFPKQKCGKYGVNSICKACQAEYKRQHYAKNPQVIEDRKAYFKKYRKSIKDQVFDHYGERCACCGETCRVFLTLDHVNGDGAEHRRELGGGRTTSTDKTWRWLVANDFPDGFQILCYNCNCGKRDNGGICPHQEAKE